jgi:hypothetical protein
MGPKIKPLPRHVRFDHPKSVALVKGHYNNYSVAKIDFLSLFHRIDRGGRANSLRKVAAISGVKRSTLGDRYNDWVDGGRQSTNDAPGVADHRGGHNRVFTEDEERYLADYIRDTYLVIGTPLHDSDIAELAKERWHFLKRSLGVAAPSFTASHRWVTTFKRRWGFSSKTGQLRKHLVDPASVEIDSKFVKDLRDSLKKVGASLVLNLDEQCIRDVTIQGKVIGNTGPDRAIIKYNGESEKGLTIINCVVADGFVLKSAAVKKGKTDKCLKSLHMDAIRLPMLGYYSDHGFITPAILIDYITTVIQPRVNGRPWVLLLDQYSGHTDATVIAFLNQLNCRILWIPGGRSGTRQPADISFHGVIRTCMADEWRRERLSDPFMEPSHADALRYYAAARTKVAAHCVQRGFAEAADWKELSTSILNRRPRPELSSSSSSSSSSSFIKWPPNVEPVTHPRRTVKQRAATRPKAAKQSKRKRPTSTSSSSSSSHTAKSSVVAPSDSKYGDNDVESKEERLPHHGVASPSISCDDPFAFPGMTPPQPSSSSSHISEASAAASLAAMRHARPVMPLSSSSLSSSSQHRLSKRRRLDHD